MRGKKSKRNCSKGGTHVCTVKLKIIYPLDVRIEPTEIALGTGTKVQQSYFGLALEMALRVNYLPVKGFRYLV